MLKLESKIVESKIESEVVEKKRRHYLFVVGWVAKYLTSRSQAIVEFENLLHNCNHYSPLDSTIGCLLIPGGRYTHPAWLCTVGHCQ